MRSEKAVQDWINSSLALTFNNEEKTGEPEVTKDTPECPSNNKGETEITTLKVRGTIFQKIVEAITF